MASGGNMGSWVPQLFYDLIARVTPGFITCVTFLMIYIKTTNTQLIINFIEVVNDSFLWKNFPTTLIIISGYAISYITGFLLRGIYSICFFFREDFNKNYVEDYNKIKFSDDKVGSRLSKLRAEIHMCTVLGMGWIFAYMLFLYRTLAITAKTFNCAEQILALAIFSGLIVTLIINYHRIRKIFYKEIDHYKQYKGIPKEGAIVEKLNTDSNL